ncbi:EAL domain-containing protein [Clostridium sp.]|uniref:sensor domain-containing protein n=1 Tax=Clostridium sp. TaxID=1506 RepID=UPI002FCBDAB0
MKESEVLNKEIKSDIDTCQCNSFLEKKLKEKERLLDAIFEVANVGISVTNEEGSYEIINETYCKIYGYSREELIGKHFTIVIPAENQDFAIEAHNSVIKGKVDKDKVWKVVKKDGSTLSVLKTSRLIQHEDGKKYKVTTVTDVTAVKETYNKLNLVSYALANSNDGVVFTSADPKEIIYVNEAFARITGYTEKELMENSNIIFRSHKNNEISWYKLFMKLKEEGFWKGEIKGKRKNKAEYVAELTLTRLVDSNGVVTNYVAIVNETTQIRWVEKRIEYLANYSSITDLPNRQVFESALNKSIKSISNPHGKVAMIMLDLDKFKNVNDLYGFTMGDKVLKAVGSRIKNVLKKSDIVAYLGEDHFGVLIESTSKINDINVIAQKIRKAILEPFVFEKQQIFMSCSIGISFFRRESKSSEDLLSNAEKAVMEAKRQGRDCIQIYTMEMNRRITRRQQLEVDLKSCIKNDELFLMYQPQINLETEKLVGVEALIRWINPTLGLIPPNEFISIAEETGLIVPIGEWVIRTACLQAKEWERNGISPFKVAINLSSVQLNQQNICNTIKGIIEDTGVSPKMIEIELTESTMMEDVTKSIEIFNGLKELGLKIAVDDFGTGYSSLSYLRKIPINKLKIDRSFIMDLENEYEGSVITKTIIHMAKNLGFKVIAEGAETKKQIQYLRENGCDEVQGYYYSKPLLSKDLEKFIKDHKEL